LLVSVIIPTYNSAVFLTEGLAALLDQDYPDLEVVINDDPRTNDDTPALVDAMRAEGLNIVYLRQNVSMAQGRKKGAEAASGEVMIHLDSDMEPSVSLVSECVSLIGEGYDGLVIPESSFGSTYWAHCRWLERCCYETVSELEALRCVRSSIYWELGGHNDEMVYFEDKDFDIRVRQQGYRLGRTRNIIYHNEGDLTLRQVLSKRVDYARSAVIAARYYPREIRWRGNIRERYRLFYQNRKLLLSHPVLTVGTFFMKACEFAVSGVHYQLEQRRR